MIDRPRFRELHFSEIDQHAGPEGYDLVQLKMDGIWGYGYIFRRMEDIFPNRKDKG